MVKDCNDNQIRNPATGRCVKKTSPLGQKILNGSTGATTKICPDNKILNPTTKRCVKKTGPIGRKLAQVDVPVVPVVPVAPVALVVQNNDAMQARMQALHNYQTNNEFQDVGYYSSTNEAANTIQNAIRNNLARKQLFVNKVNELDNINKWTYDYDAEFDTAYDRYEKEQLNKPRPRPKVKRTNKRNELQDEFFDAPYAAESKKYDKTLKKGRKIKAELNKAIINTYDFKDAPYAAESKKYDKTLKKGRKIKGELNKAIIDAYDFKDAPYAAQSKKYDKTLKRGSKIKEQYNRLMGI